MSQYQTLKTQIQQNIKQNGEGEIRGDILQTQLLDMINALGAGYQFMGVATPTNPESAQTPDYKCFYLATTPGTYANLGGLVVADGEVALLKWDSAWTKEVTGAATAKQLNQLGQKVDSFQGDTSLVDFAILDETGHAILISGNGELKTKNFDSSKIKINVVDDSYLSDFTIQDADNNTIFFVKDGHIFTKNFNSKKMSDSVELMEESMHNISGSNVLFDLSFSSEIPADFTENANWTISNGKVVSTSAGLANRLQVKQCVTIDKRVTTCRFTAHADTKFAIGWVVPSGCWKYCSTLIGIDAENSSVNIYNAWNSPNTLPTVLETLSYTFVNGRDYIFKIRKDEHINYVSIIDCLTGEQSEEIHTTQTSNVDAGLGEFAGGRQLGYMSLVHIGGTSPEVSWLRVSAEKANPLVIVYGDSITQGARLYNGQSYVDLLADSIGRDKGVYASAIDGATIATIKPIMAYEIPILKPKYVIVTIGTNSGGSQSDYDALLAQIESYGAIPIINVPPCPVTDDVPAYWQYILNLGIQSALFNVATALNNAPEDGRNTALYADNSHPNANGHTAMFKRFFIDVNRL